MATAYLSRKLLNYVMSNHPKLISGTAQIKICDEALKLAEINDNELMDICNKRQMFMRLFIGYSGISFMLLVLYWVFLIFEKF